MPKYRYNEISKCRNTDISDDIQGSIAFRISAATPKLPAGVDAFLGNTFDHGFPTAGTLWGVVLNVLLCSVIQSLSCETLCKTTFFLECFQQVLYLTTQHLCQSVAEHQHTVGSNEGIAIVEPWIKLVFLSKDVDTALMQYIVLIGRTVETDVINRLKRCIFY